MLTTIWNCAHRTWQVGIGDPGIMGWVIVAVYVLTGLAAFRTASSGRFPYTSAGRERFFWRALGLIMILLAINKQLDLQSLLTASARCMAQLQGWYGSRRIVQVGFIIVLLALMSLLAIITLTILRGTMRRTGLALIGLSVVLAFVAVRAVGFHHMDQLINMRFQNIRVNWIMEMAGPLMILTACILNLRADRNQ